MKRILLIGSQGQLGWELLRTLSPLGQVFAYGRQNLDLTNPVSIQNAVDHVNPHIIVNAAAYTAVDKAETEASAAFSINKSAVELLAIEAKRRHALLVHFSTDYVFDGSEQQPYLENAPTAPLNVYGESKLAGEKAIQMINCRHLIFRTSWVYGMRGKNFLLTMLRLAKERDQLKIVDDQVGVPNWSRMLAESTSQILSICDKNSELEQSGIYNLSSTGQTSWFGFAAAIFKEYNRLHSDFKIPKLLGIPAAEYPTPAKRPQNSVLATDKLCKQFGIVLPDWHETLLLCLDNT
jgi:dTDP-4-dehydrorhamnose reductase